MPLSTNSYTGNGTTTDYALTFSYLDSSHVKASINGTPTTAFTFLTASTIRFTAAPANGAAIKIYRETPSTSLLADFSAGSAIREQDLELDLQQVLSVTQEVKDYVDEQDTATLLAQVNTANSNASSAVTTANSALSTVSASMPKSGGTFTGSVTISSGSLTTSSGSNTAASFIPTGSTVPANGMYLSAANNVSIATNSAVRLTVNSGGDVTATGASLAASFIPTGSTVPVNGMYLSASNTIALATGSTGRAYLTSGGNLLIGDSTSVSGAFSGTARLQGIANSGAPYYAGGFYSFHNDANPTVLQIGHSRSNSSGGFAVLSNNDGVGHIRFEGANGTAFNVAAQVVTEIDGTPSSTSMPGRLLLFTTPSGSNTPAERLRLTNGGVINLNGQRTTFGTPMPGSGNVRIAAASAGGIAYNTYDTQDYTAAQFVRDVSGTATQVGTITCTSSATAYNTSSDYRLKENVVVLEDAIDRLKQIPVHRFNFIVDPGHTVDGFLAHEVQEIVPEAVTGHKDAVDENGDPIHQGIDQSKLVPLLTAALKEAVSRIESLETRITALELGI